MKFKILIVTLILVHSNVRAQEYFPDNKGVKTKNTNYKVFENARIHVDPNTVIEQGMFAIQNGKITDIGTSIAIPENSIRIDLKGKEVYPSFIDIYSEFGINKPMQDRNANSEPQYDANREGYYWNDHIRPENNAVEKFSFHKEDAEKLHKNGFGVVNTHLADGIIRGSGILVALKPDGTEGERILSERSAQYLSFEKSVQTRQLYPTSIMGAMALLRQTYLDAAWYSREKSDNKDLALEALNNNRNLVQIFKTDNILDELRADKVGDDSGVQYVIFGSGNEFEYLDEIKNTKATIIVPIDFPEPFDLEDPFMANYVSLQDMKRWNQAPANLRFLSQKGIPFVLTSHGLKDEKKFKPNLLKAIEYGLDKTVALAALTTFTHILEGYKVADKMKVHGAGASTFSDWWAYKYEVKDAIPYNAAIMYNAGLTVAINSDDSEMSRRLNQEAAKTVKYGGVPEEEAWKFVTLNPAKLMHIEQYVGSIQPGRDADVVLWSGHPLSIYTKAEKTLIEGAIYFDLEHDKEMRKEIEVQKNLITGQMLDAKNGGEKTRLINPKEEQHIHCNTLEIY